MIASFLVMLKYLAKLEINILVCVLDEQHLYFTYCRSESSDWSLHSGLVQTGTMTNSEDPDTMPH